MLADYQNITLASTIGYDTLIVIYETCICFGGISAIINIILLLIFITYKPFRAKHQLLITLAIADLVSCLSIFWLGLERQILYENVLNTLTIPVRTSLDCALKTSAWMQVLGDVWPPTILLLLAIEKILAVHFPLWYHLHMPNENRYVQAIGSFVFTIATLLVGFLISYLINNTGNQAFNCGRKAAFSVSYGVFVYFWIIIGYLASFVMQLIAYCGAKRQQNASSEMARLVRRIRSLLFISAFSVILISIPNIVKLMQVYLPAINISDQVSQSVNCVTCVNFSLDLFVYFKFNADFHERVIHLVRVKLYGGNKIASSTLIAAAKPTTIHQQHTLSHMSPKLNNFMVND